MPADYPRAVLARVETALTDTPIVAINGPRQVGKTTLAGHVQRRVGGRLITFDDHSQLAAALDDPRGFAEQPVEGPLIVDEVQRAPGLFRAIKAAVDRDRRPGRFVLTGSSRLLSEPDFADSFVGRVEVVELWPLSPGELAATAPQFPARLFRGDVAAMAGLRNGPRTRADYAEIVTAGGFPEALARPRARRPAWFQSYLNTLVDTTARDLPGLERTAELPALVRLCAARTGGELNVTNLAGELGMPRRTLDGYLAVLVRRFVVGLVPGWTTKLGKQVTRRPKLAVVDTGLAAALNRITPANAFDPHVPFGPLLETFVVNEVRRQIGWGEDIIRLFHFRDRDGAEVDLVLERNDGRVAAIEVKTTMSAGPGDARGLRFLADRLGERFAGGVLLSMTPEPFPLGTGLVGLPIDTLWQP